MLAVFSRKEWLPRKDSNLNKENQNLLCYRYTTRQLLTSRQNKGIGAFCKNEAASVRLHFFSSKHFPVISLG